ncbi:hypothetical protein [Kitasatospora sp. NPDC093806]|uniref:hypothetical protein n=1 Tax=Kitasatospora sp. NPDC093806 TaxID=3155075 RepID=UPI00342C9487
MSYGKVKAVVAGHGAGAACPFGLDLGGALKAAGVERAVAPAGGAEPPVRAEVVPGQEVRPESVQVWCSYTAGATPVEIGVLAAPAEKIAVNLALPYLQRAGRLTVDQLTAVSTDQPSPGEARTTPGAASVGIARRAVTGKGDLALLVSQGTETSDLDRALTGEPLRKVAEALAAQLHV